MQFIIFFVEMSFEVCVCFLGGRLFISSHQWVHEESQFVENSVSYVGELVVWFGLICEYAEISEFGWLHQKLYQLVLSNCKSWQWDPAPCHSYLQAWPNHNSSWDGPWCLWVVCVSCFYHYFGGCQNKLNRLLQWVVLGVIVWQPDIPDIVTWLCHV